MPEHRAPLQDRYGHPDIAIWLASPSAPNVTWLIDYFDAQVRDGVVFSDGETVQIGWMIVSLRRDGEGRLAVWEPRLDVMPIEWVKGADSTLRHLTIQRTVCEEIAAEPMYPSLGQTGVVSLGLLDDSNDFHMSRDEPEQQDSGWVFTEPDPLGESARLASLFEVAVAHPAAIPFLALPPGAAVTHTATQIELAYGAKQISSRSNAFLARLLASNASRQQE